MSSTFNLKCEPLPLRLSNICYPGGMKGGAVRL